MGKQRKDRLILFSAILFAMIGAFGLIFAGNNVLYVSADTTLTASLTSPEAIGGTVTSGVDRNSAVFTFTFSEAVKNNTLNTGDKVSIVKVSDSTVVATANSTDAKITFPSLGTNGSTSVAFTVDPTVLEPSTEYQFILDSAITSVPGNTMLSDVVYNFTTAAEATDPTHFSAALASPSSESNVVTNGVNLNSAVFTFTFSEAVKNNALNTEGKVSIVKTSDSTVVATANSTDGKITFPSLGTNGSTAAAFTVDPTVLEPSTEYQFILNGSIVSNTNPAKTLGTDVVYSFITTSDPLETPEATFEAISLYPVLNAKDVAVDASFEIGFTEPIKTSDNISSGEAIELIDTASGSILPAAFTVSEDQTVITVDPSANLNYGQNYILKIVDGKIQNATETQTLAEMSISFKTTSFNQMTASAIVNGAGADLTVQMTNASSKAQNSFIQYVARRDKGARLQDGGTVLLSAITEQVSCTAKTVTIKAINLADLSLDQFGNPVAGDVYIDLYIVNSSGELISEPLHIKVE